MAVSRADGEKNFSGMLINGLVKKFKAVHISRQPSEMSTIVAA